MLLTHIYFNGRFNQTIELYKQAFNATVKTLIEDSGHLLIVHNEIVIHNKFLILNDFGNKNGVSISERYQPTDKIQTAS
ncbi:hypothetical protein DFW26_12345 [Clostridioides difficile]|nr:hypothetical protein [Clostridioides difficile]HBG8467827.1 hypothetical protein [Clostridioides difficile]